MAEAFLDSSIAIGLVFRHAGEQAVCRAVLTAEGSVVCSRYVVFEVARGFLRSLIALHNYSYEFDSFAGLHQAAHAGQQRFRPYRMHTWLGAFDDYFTALEAEDGISGDSLKLEEFRAKLRGWIRRGWQRIHRDFSLTNRIGCREDLPPPMLQANQRIDQHLPDRDCGQPAACRLQAFIHTWQDQVEAVVDGLECLPAATKDRETVERIDGLRHLLATPPGIPFEGKKCYRCGDALICLEAPPGSVVITKNQKHFEPLTRILGKSLAVAQTVRA